MFKKLLGSLTAVCSVIIGFLSAGLVVTSSGVTLETADISTLTDANTAYLSTVFQVVQLLPYIAVMAGGFFLISKIFSIIPKAGGQ